MAKITITIPDNKVERILNAIKGLKPIPKRKDPENEGEFINKFSDAIWAKMSVIAYLQAQVLRYERKVAQNSIDISDIELS